MSAYQSDLGLPTEKLSGYFDAPWRWPAIRRNAGFVLQLAGRDDPLVPFQEQKAVADHLSADLHA